MTYLASILIVDDEATWLKELSQILTGAGYDVREAESGEKALELLAACKPDLVLLDIGMPGIGGLEVFRRMKENEAGRRVPVILFSEGPEPERREDGFALGAADCIVKPFRSGELLARVRMQLEISRLRDGLEAADGKIQAENARHQIAEEELKKSEAFLTFALQTMSAGAWDLDLVDHTSHRTLLHDQIFGYESLLPTWTYEMFLEHVLPEDRPEVDRRFQEATATQADWSFECRIRRADGEGRWIFAAGSHVRNTAGKPVHMSGIVQDITLRKATEARISRLTNLYSALSQCDHAVVHSTTVEELLRTICRVVVECGGMKMAWIGIVEEESGAVRITDSFGTGTGYLDGLQVSMNVVDPMGRGPTGTAIREGRPVWIQDFQRDAITAPWHERGARYGWASVAALPLRRGGKPIGAITIYSDKSEVFDEEARTLLVEMSFDVSFALDGFARKEERKQMEMALFQHRNMLEQILNSIPQSVSWKDRNSVYLGCNSVSAKRVGLAKPGDIAGKTDYDFPHPRHEVEAYIADDRNVMENNKPKFHYIEPLQQADGTRIWIDTTKVPLTDASGQVYGGLSVYDDITQRLEAEKAVQESENRLSFALQASRMGAWEVNLEDYSSHHTPIYDQIFGYESAVSEWSYRIFLNHVLPEDRADVDWLFHEAVSRQSEWTFECRILRADGEVRWIRVTGGHEKDQSGKPARVIGVVQDITERKLAQNLLKESEAKLRAILESTADGLLAVDNEGNVLHSSRSFAELWRVPSSLLEIGSDKELLAFATSQLIDPEGFSSKVRELYNSDNRSTDTLAFKDGRVFERYSLPMLMDGTRIGRVWAFRDITERRRAEKDLENKNAELERFTYTVSHDLKSPLVTIKTFLGYLEDDLRKEKRDAVAKDFAFIHSAADKMAILLSELLMLARVGHSRNPSVEVPLQEVVEEALNLVAGQIAERGVQVELTNEPVVLYGDRQRLVEVFQNLIDNAVKFLGDQTGPRIEIGVEMEGNEIAIFVRDNGKGIDPRHLSKLFGLFEKLDPHSPGSGMGLAMVKRIVEAHGGNIQAQSKGIGNGSTFRFTLAKTQFMPGRASR